MATTTTQDKNTPIANMATTTGYVFRQSLAMILLSRYSVNMIRASFEGKPMSNHNTDVIYQDYQNLGGKIERPLFEKLLTVFYDLTLAAYSGGHLSRHLWIEAEIRDVNPKRVADQLWHSFMFRIGLVMEAPHIFEAASKHAKYL